jgi:hypothetical protein
MDRLFLTDRYVQTTLTIGLWGSHPSIAGARTLRIRTTEAFAGGRPQITVNSFTSNAPPGT